MSARDNAQGDVRDPGVPEPLSARSLRHGQAPRREGPPHLPLTQTVTSTANLRAGAPAWCSSVALTASLRAYAYRRPLRRATSARLLPPAAPGQGAVHPYREYASGLHDSRAGPSGVSERSAVLAVDLDASDSDVGSEPGQGAAVARLSRQQTVPCPAASDSPSGGRDQVIPQCKVARGINGLAEAQATQQNERRPRWI